MCVINFKPKLFGFIITCIINLIREGIMDSVCLTFRRLVMGILVINFIAAADLINIESFSCRIHQVYTAGGADDEDLIVDAESISDEYFSHTDEYYGSVATSTFSPLGISGRVSPGIGDFGATTTASGEWIFTSSAEALELTVFEYGAVYFGAGSTYAHLEWRLDDITDQYCVMDGSISLYHPIDGLNDEITDTSVSVAFNPNPQHLYGLYLLNIAYAWEDNSCETKISAAFDIFSVPECTTLRLLALCTIGIILMAIVKKRLSGQVG